jgi:hypothetical protein
MSKGYRDFIGTYITDTGEIRFGRVLLIENDQLWDPKSFTDVLLAPPNKRLKLGKKIARYWANVMAEAEEMARQWEEADVRVYRIDENGVEDITDNPDKKEDPSADES